jgi:three-Cys-motif partner protein
MFFVCSYRVESMAITSAIEWTNATWNPVTGCTKISTGCDNCYAERFSERFRGVPGHPFENGFDLTLRPERLRQPLSWRQSKMIFVNSMSDLFHKTVPKRFVDQHDPDSGFHVATRVGKFEDAIPEILDFVGNAFTLTFIDPTGWKGYGYNKIGPLLRREPGEVLINFMYDFINRFAPSEEEKIEKSLEPILGGPGWKDRLDPGLPKGQAVEKLFREELERAGGFEFVLSTRDDMIRLMK